MDPNHTIIAETAHLSHEELLFEYEKLSGLYLELRNTNENSLQQIHELKRNLQVATAAETYLSQELEAATSNATREHEEIVQRYKNQIDDLKNRNSILSTTNSQLETKIEELINETEESKFKLKELISQNEKPVILKSVDTEKELELEHRIDELTVCVEEAEKCKRAKEIDNENLNLEIGYLKEKLECMGDTLNQKREILEEKDLLIDSLHEQIVELSSELAELKNAPDLANKKGNSLFAEVDDQRQKMKSVLAAQKKHYLKMQRLYNDSEYEIKRLKKENAAMHNEMQICTSIFLKADQNYKTQMNEQFQILRDHNEKLQKKLNTSEEKLANLARSKGEPWVDSMLSFCENETKQLKDQLYSCMMAKAQLDDNLRSAQQELAKWRFEALKSRCIILDREGILEDKNIPFKPVYFCAANKDLYSNATPHIITKNSPPTPPPTNSIKLLPSPLTETPAVPKPVVKSTAIEPIVESVKTEIPVELPVKFDIYEDTTTTLPTVKPPHIIAKHSPPTPQTETPAVPKPVVKSTTIEPIVESVKTEIPVELPIKFDIYEDTTTTLPTVKPVQIDKDDNNISPSFEVYVDKISKCDNIGETTAKDFEFKKPLIRSRTPTPPPHVIGESPQYRDISLRVNRSAYNDDSMVIPTEKLNVVVTKKTNVIVKKIFIKSKTNNK